MPQQPLRIVRMVIAYDGSRFNGWQRQSASIEARKRSLQDVIETAAARVLGRQVPAPGLEHHDGSHPAMRPLILACR